MRTIIWFLYFWLYLILVLPEYWRVCRMGKQGKTEQHNRLVRTHVNNWAGRLLRLAGADITTTGTSRRVRWSLWQTIRAILTSR